MRGRVLEPVIVRDAIEHRGLQRTERSRMRDTAPETGQRLPRPFAPADGQAVGQYSGVHRARAGRADALEPDARVLENAVEHAPGERAVRAAALQCEVD